MMPIKNKVFKNLKMSEIEGELIDVCGDQTVRFQFPFDVQRISIGRHTLKMDQKTEMDFYDSIVDFFTAQMIAGGFRDNCLFTVPRNCRKDLEFYKEFNSEDEAKEAIQWLLNLKKRFGIL